MKICQNCNAQMDDKASFCTNCGKQFVTQEQQGYQQNTVPPQYYTAPEFDPYDHTAKFNPQDISDNKVFAMICYLLGIIGVVIALLASRNSEYTMFHVRQALKFTVVEILTAIVVCVLFWTIIVPIVAGCFIAVLFIIKIVCFFQICSGKAKEPAIIKNIGFLR